MKNKTYRPLHLVLLAVVFGGVSILWMLLGGAVTSRSVAASRKMAEQVEGNWGPRLEHSHPVAAAMAVGTREPKGTLLPESSKVLVNLDFRPQKKGLITHRTYYATLDATYEWKNPEPVDLQLDIEFSMPGQSTRIDEFQLVLDDKVAGDAPPDGRVKANLILPANGSKTMTVRYSALGKDDWRYLLGTGGKARNFSLIMETNFSEFNVPVSVESPTSRKPGAAGVTHIWDFPNVTGVEAVGLEVPSFVDAARVASRMSFFGPLSLGLFFVVLIIAALRMGVFLHFMHFVLLAAACFAFQLLFAYSVDVMPPGVSFVIAAAVSVGLVASYLRLVAGVAYMRLAIAAQVAYIILFNATFFFEGYTGLTLTVVGIVTLGLIMTGTARMDWSAVLDFAGGRENHSTGAVPPALPV